MIKAAALFALLSAPVFGLDTSKLKPTGYVNDFAHVLDAGSQQRLEAYCGNLERLTGAQMAIVLVDTLDGDPVEDVANKLYREWGIGKKGKDEGVLILLAVKDRKSRAEIGYGLEPIIPDGFAGGVLRGVRPILAQGNYGGALLAAAQQMGSRIAQDKGVSLGEEQPVPRTRTYSRGPELPFPLIVFGFLALLWLLSRLGGGRGGGGGGGTGLLAGMLLGNMMGRRGGFGGGDWGGGGFGGGGGGGGGFGGFGGGDSGGGGASSDW